MMKVNQIRQLGLVLAAIIGMNQASAQDGQPVAVNGTANFSSVSLSWQAPSSPVTIQWHNGEDYNGMDGRPLEAGGPSVIYAANKFAPTHLAAMVGQTIESISFYEYRPVSRVNVQIYQDKQLVVDQVADLSNYQKDSWRTVVLQHPYVVPRDKEVMIVARIEAGHNVSFIAITDRAPQPGKGDVYSYDGNTWYQGAPGDFLVTANVKNNFTGEPDGYNIYRDGTKVNAELVTDLSYELTDEPDGLHSYAVSAVYADGERQAYPIELNVVAASNLAAPASTFSGETDELTGLLSWTAPLKGGDVLSWSGDVMGNHIGGTASTNTKVWVKQEFDRNDMLAFQNYTLDAISAYVAEKEIITATIFVMRDGKIVFSQVVPDSVVQAIQAPGWLKMDLGMPYKMETGHTYAYGVYYTHTPKTHPVGVDNTAEVNVKGNSFSVSSPSSSSFNASNPSWKTLKSGNIPGNFMLKAHVSPVGDATEPLDVAGYDLYRDGNLIESDITGLDYLDEVPEPGIHNYRLVAKYAGGKVGSDMTLALTYAMPAAYAAPLIVKSEFDRQSRQVDLAWSTEAATLQKYGTPSYMVGFDEDMTAMVGAKFTAAELQPYVGYKFGSIKFGVGSALDFALQIRTGDNQVLWSMDFAQDDIQPLALYTLNIPDDVRIPEGKDIYLAYSATLPGGQSPILIDDGPLAEGGAMISLTGGANWMKLGTINPDYNNYNVVIGATIMPAETPAQGVGLVQLGEVARHLHAVTLSGAQAREGLAIEAARPSEPTHRALARKADSPRAASYRVYRNNQLYQSTAQTTFSEVLDKWGVVEYYVTAIYDNGWESPASKVVSIDNPIDQLSPAPFDLRGEQHDGNLNLSWTAPGDVQEANYFTDVTQDLALGLTHSSGKVTSYQAIRFGTDTLPDMVGKTLTHIKFKLSAEVSAATVVVMLGDNIIYEQDVDNPVVGWNVVRLNQPYTIGEGLTLPVGIGYSASYTSGTRCLTLDPGAARPMVNDVISTTLEAGYWYSLMTKYKQNYGWRISGVLQTPDQHLAGNKAPRRGVDGLTYNVYRDGQLVADGITATSYVVAAAQAGHYTVTATTAGTESAPSNAVCYGLSERGDVTGDGKVDIADVNGIINIMLGKAQTTATADITGDGKVDIADVNAAINIMLGHPVK
ncbi:MAG: hypothetical protein IJ160_03100 [Muribaculaceae bacterium]|nr:hypothetical protein [Muribaculaceae bacterium]